MIVLGGLVNPYGTDAMTYGLLSYGDQIIHDLVAEMRPITAEFDLGKIFFVLAALSFWLVGKKRIPLTYALLMAGTGYMTLNAWRNFSLFMYLGNLGVVYTVRDFHWQLPDTREGAKQARRLGAVLLVSLLAVAAVTHYRNNDGGEQDYYGKEALKYVLARERPEDVRMFNGYNGVGCYMEFNGIKCYMDTRAEVFLAVNNHREDVLYEYYNLHYGFLDYRDFFAKYKFNYAYITEIDTSLYYIMLRDTEMFELLYEHSFILNGKPIKCRLYHVKGADE